MLEHLTPTRVVIADDHEINRVGLASLLDASRPDQCAIRYRLIALGERQGE